ncbi:hypothetical protein [Turicibacter sanguinis]|uniref:hypothetical protein n=1 Tax=Turicibacter sanguinis TaxID=154288 RepID=UPI0018ABAB0B|nr:hypothetical protein [Turicibacter sanguinis]MDB8551403.1 hypothetical protein [Turicibacter sanguinis]
MKPKQILIKLLLVSGVIALGLPLLISSPTLHLLEEKDISPIANRMNNRALFTIKLDDFGQPISYSPLIPDESIPTLAGATSQQQILQDHLEEVRQEVENAQDELEILKIQKNILIEESSAYTESLQKTYLEPLQTIKNEIQSLETENIDLPLLAITNCIHAISTFVENPNQSDYDHLLNDTLSQLNEELQVQETSGWIETASRFLKSGMTQTKLSLKLSKVNDLMTQFSQSIQSNDSNLEAFKKTKRQQKATEDAISTKYVELDELILELSGILSEIEEVTQ